MRRAQLSGAASSAWAEAKAGNDWPRFQEALRPLLACVREEADRIGQALGMSRYDALLDGFDAGLRRATIEPLFEEIAGWLPGMIAAAVARQAAEPEPIAPVGPFDVTVQAQLCRNVMTMLGFDFDHGRLDTSLHPFTAGTADDVRLTTRYREEDVFIALLGLVHETGHARYQRGLPVAWRGQPLGEPCSASMHEAQAIIFERQLGRTPAFIARLVPMLVESFGAQPAFETGNLVRLLTRVRPGAIRVEADELTYPAHIIVRTRIEIALIEGEAEVADIPGLWDRGMAELLGIDTRGDAAKGPLQDVHWGQGMFGYFPSYLVGAIAAAQLYETFTKSGGEADPIALGDWLRTHIWSQGALMTASDLLPHVTGAPPSGAALRAHFQRRYGVQ